jgi:hypothetical protein
LVFLVVSFLLAFPPISYMHFPSPPFVPHALPISSTSIGSIIQKLIGEIHRHRNNMEMAYAYFRKVD